MKNPSSHCLIFFLLLAAMPTFGTETAPEVDWDAKEENYETHGMEYAKKLYLRQDGSPTDDLRTRKSDALNYALRTSTVNETKKMLLRTKDMNLRRELMRRLGSLYEQQAETISRQSGIPDKENTYKNHVQEAVHWYAQLRKYHPTWNADFVLFSMAENYVKLKNYSSAEARYRELIQKERRSPLLSDALLALGNLYFERQGFTTARNYYRQILATNESKLHAYAHYKIGWCFFNEAEHESAMAALEKSIQESRRLQAQQYGKKLGVEEEALSDLVLFYSEYANPNTSKSYFENIVSEDKARDLRFSLVKRYFEHGQHQNAKVVANELLGENGSVEQKNKLYLIVISVAEKLKDRNLSLDTAQKFSAWIKTQGEDRKSERAESEEYLRLYAQRLHYEAETLKQKETWTQAKRSYEIYLNTFGADKEAQEARYRYSVLLMNQREFLKAYEQIKILLPGLEPSHARHKEVLRLQVQSLEMASKKNKESVNDAEMLSAYDAFTAHYPDDALAVEGFFKAAQLAKTVEGPELAARRFRAVAEKYPQQEIARTAISESITTLIKAEKWEALRDQSGELEKSVAANLDDKKTNLVSKIAEAKELAMLKITEKLEQDGKFMEALAQYESFLDGNVSPSFARLSLARMALIAERQLHEAERAIRYWEQMKEKHRDSKEGKRAILELARLYEKTVRPIQAAENYLFYSDANEGDMASLTNAAILLESVGNRMQSGTLFLRLYEKLGRKTKESTQAFESACNNLLLATHSEASNELYKKIADCSARMATTSTDFISWQTREAWALERIGENASAAKIWSKLAKVKSQSASTELEKRYIAMAKIRNLESHLADFREFRFSKTNEKPEANIGKKSQMLESLEAKAAALLKISSPKQIVLIQKVLEQAYLDFAETMIAAALPSKLSEQDSNAMKKSFMDFATEMRKRASEIAEKQKELEETAKQGERAIASTSPELPAINSSEAQELEKNLLNGHDDPSVLARLAYYKFSEGHYGEARYLSQKWKKGLERAHSKDVLASPSAYEVFAKAIEEKIPNEDPVAKEWL